nr:MAG TPA: hypothetical protein [Caudoviricetes sp.]
MCISNGAKVSPYLIKYVVRAATILYRERFGKDWRSSSLTYWTYSAL